MSMESKMTDQLLRYVEFAGIPVYAWVKVSGWDAMSPPLPYITVDPWGDAYLVYRDQDGKHTRTKWTDQTYLGKLVIADACLQSEKWPQEWIVEKLNDGFHVTELCWLSWKDKDDIPDSHETVAIGQTWADAVLAAVEEVGK